MGVSQVSLPAADGAQPDDESPLPEKRYLDREESWLRFNERVLELAEDESIPLLERVRFLAIFATNLDEFFMVRVAGLVRRMVAGFPVEGAGVRLPGQVLENTLELAGELTVRHARAFSERINPELAEHGIELLRWKELSCRRARYPRRAVQAAHLPRAHPARGGPGAPVSLHLRPVAQPRRADRGPEDGRHRVRQGQGSAAAAEVPRAVAEPVRADRGRHRRAPDRPVRRRGGDRASRVPRHQDQGPRGRRGHHGEPAAGDGAGTRPAQVRARGPARGRGHDVG